MIPDCLRSHLGLWVKGQVNTQQRSVMDVVGNLFLQLTFFFIANNFSLSPKITFLSRKTAVCACISTAVCACVDLYFSPLKGSGYPGSHAMPSMPSGGYPPQASVLEPHETWNHHRQDVPVWSPNMEVSI